MARKKKLEIIEDPESLREERERTPVNKETVRRALSFAGWTFGLVVMVFGVAFVLLQGEQFLSSDARFKLPAEGLSAKDSGVTVNGVHNASKNAVMRVFEADRGRSIIDVEPQKRRLALRRVDWVRDASVRRVWPNQLQVDIEERKPVAIIQVAAQMTGDFNNPVTFKPMLIDGDGFILPVRGPIPQNLPLLTGLRATEDVERRRTRVLHMMRLMDELRDYRDRIQEVDVSDLENLRIAYQAQDQQVILILGNEKYQERLNTFLRHYDGIRDKLSPRAVLDVSMENRINAVAPADSARKEGSGRR